MYQKIYMIFTVVLLLGFAFIGFVGWVPGTAPRQFVPTDVRHAAGGYRSFHFWHSGYQGGK